MTVDPALMRQAAVKARRVDQLVGRLAAWTIHPPADPSANEQDIETEARAEMRDLVAIFRRGRA